MGDSMLLSPLRRDSTSTVTSTSTTHHSHVVGDNASANFAAFGDARGDDLMELLPEDMAGIAPALSPHDLHAFGASLAPLSPRQDAASGAQPVADSAYQSLADNDLAAIENMLSSNELLSLQDVESMLHVNVSVNVNGDEESFV